ncbi:uroporphyrinogen-III C-methyltransferase [Azohydromonas sediminis]|uniref:uroporphyrinogen-III C-methyltransferase n=1 Tax=Azohydromonas sediminis TaxID=2259674 RepID=UPI000E659A4A|nr:uroporphyrinogen-III C-methyltransferase [Azohydromonas sediminis]
MSSNDASPEPAAPVPPADPPGASPAAAPAAARPAPGVPRALWIAAAAALLLGAGGAYLGWSAQHRVGLLEQELVRRQQATETAVTEARVLANEAQDAARDAAARVALLDARVSEAALQRSQVEQLLQSLARSRDDKVVADVDSALRLAMRHATLLGSTEPVVVALRQADERLAQLDSARVQRVRTALARDLQRLGAVRTPDIATLAARVDEVLRQVDELPLVALVEPRRAPAVTPRAEPAAPAAAAASAPDAPASAAGWLERVPAVARDVALRVWAEAKSVLRITRIEDPGAMLLTPEQAYFVRETLKLRLLSARLALLARQFDLAQTDLHAAAAMIERQFDPQSRRVQVARDTLRQAEQQAREVELPRPDETLAALAALLR